MSRPCVVCSHQAVATINDELRSGRPIRRVAASHGLSYQSVGRHAAHHVTAVEPDASLPDVSGVTPQIDALDELIGALRTRALSGDPAAAREYRLALASQASQQATAPEYDVLADPRWKRLQTLILRVLERHPAARLEVIEAIRRLDG